MKKIPSLLACLILITCLTACGSRNGISGADDNKPEAPGEETVAEAEPLSDSDFVVMINNETEESNELDNLDGFESSAVNLYYYDPGQDDSRAGVLTTSRGISLGDAKEKVIEKYGDGESGAFDESNDFGYSILVENQADDLAAQMSAECVTYVRYYYQADYSITFYFDGNDEVSWMTFSKVE